jgi:hypothetical protein
MKSFFSSSESEGRVEPICLNDKILSRYLIAADKPRPKDVIQKTIEAMGNGSLMFSIGTITSCWPAIIIGTNNRTVAVTDVSNPLARFFRIDLEFISALVAMALRIAKSVESDDDCINSTMETLIRKPLKIMK